MVPSAQSRGLVGGQVMHYSEQRELHTELWTENMKQRSAGTLRQNVRITDCVGNAVGRHDQDL